MKYRYRIEKRTSRFLVTLLSILSHNKKNKINGLENLKRVALVYPHLLGDAIMLIPFLRILKKHNQNIEITLVCHKGPKEILENQNLVKKFITFEKSGTLLGGKKTIQNIRDVFFTLKKARNIKYDAVIEPFGNIWASCFMNFMRADFYIGVDFSNLNKLQTITIPYLKDEHLVDVMLNIPIFFNLKISESDKYPKLFLTQEQTKYKSRFIAEHNFHKNLIIGIHPGASVSSRRWSGFADLVKKLCLIDNNMRFLFFGGPTDTDNIKKLFNSLEDCHKQNVVICQKEIKEYIALLSICNHVICNDSSCGHIAASLNVPVTVLFAQGDPRKIAPRSENEINIISRDFDCKPCLSNFCPKGTNECIKWITTDIVLDSVIKSIKKITKNE